MSQRIHRLSSLTIDTIAAGEVVDVPSSCVKELVENSIDAGATDILVEVVLGGRELIRVSDDGCGMGRDDVIASIERHTTSKLTDISDLERLTSRGFRGEALASIVAVSRVTVTSAEEGAGPLCPATALSAEGGLVVSVSESVRARGTTVEAASLFFNVPARRKFLKSPAKDTADIIKTVTSLALTAPQISFRLIVDGRLLFSVQGGGRLPDRAKALLKDPFLQDGIELSHTQEGISVEGLIVDPRSLRSNRSGQYLIVNGRSVTSWPISYAVRAAYGTACDERRHPLFVLNVTLDPASIDVNVHPQKKRFVLRMRNGFALSSKRRYRALFLGNERCMSCRRCSPAPRLKPANGSPPSPIYPYEVLRNPFFPQPTRCPCRFRRSLAVRSVSLSLKMWPLFNRMPTFLAEFLEALFWLWTCGRLSESAYGRNFLREGLRSRFWCQYPWNARPVKSLFSFRPFRLLNILG